MLIHLLHSYQSKNYPKPESLPWKYHADSKPETKYNNQLQKFSKNRLHELILQYFELIQLHVPDYAMYKNTNALIHSSRHHKYIYV